MEEITELNISTLTNPPCAKNRHCSIFDLEKNSNDNIYVSPCFGGRMIDIQSCHCTVSIKKTKGYYNECQFIYSNSIIINKSLGDNSSKANNEDKIAYFLSKIALKSIEKTINNQEELVYFLLYKDYTYRLASCFLQGKKLLKQEIKIKYISYVESEIIYKDFEILNNLFAIIDKEWINFAKENKFKFNSSLDLFFNIIESHLKQDYKQSLELAKNKKIELEKEFKKIISFDAKSSFFIHKFKKYCLENASSNELIDKYLSKEKYLFSQKTKYIKNLAIERKLSIDPKLFLENSHEKYLTNALISAINHLVYLAGAINSDFWNLNLDNSLGGGEDFPYGHIELQIRDRYESIDLAEVAYQSKEVIANQFGESTLKLHCILALIAFREPKAWDRKITISASTLLAHFGENKIKNHYISKNERKPSQKATVYFSKEEKLKELAHHIHLIKRLEVWIKEWRDRSKGIFTVETANLWDIFNIKQIIQQETNGEDKLIDIEFTYSPGSWFDKFTAHEHLKEPGYFSKEILRLNPKQGKMVFRLAYYALFYYQKTDADLISIETLLKNVGYEKEIEIARINSNAASNLERSFNRTLKTLAKLEYPLSFIYTTDTPQWVNPQNKIKKPRHWFDNWLKCSGTLLKPKFELNKKPSLLAEHNFEQNESQAKTEETNTQLSFGQLIKNTRKSNGISLRAAAKQLRISASRLSQIENDCYPHPITPELENRLLEFFNLK